MLDTAEILSEFVSSLKIEEISDETIQDMRMFLLDYFAASMAGYRTNRPFNHVIEEMLFESGGREESSVLFSDRKLPCMDAAYLNACYAHGADMDDGNRKAMGHIGAHVISAVLALAEQCHATEQEAIVAIIVGYEVFCRVAAAAQPGLVHRGFHSTGTVGVIACAAASAKLLGLNAEEIYNAIAISVTQASGLMIIAESGQSIKPLNPANAARCGILSARLAAKGVQGGKYPLDSEKGWFHAMTEYVDATMITAGLGQKFCIEECYIKPYPSCRHTHCGIQAAKRIREKQDLQVNEIQKVDLYIYKNAIQIAGQIAYPQSDEEAKFSIKYALSCMLVLGQFGLDQLNVQTVPKAVKQMVQKTELICDDSMENRETGIRGCRLVITVDHGRSYEEIVRVPKGDPEDPFTVEDMRKKFSHCAGNLLTWEEQAERVDSILHFGGDRPVGRILP